MTAPNKRHITFVPRREVFFFSEVSIKPIGKSLKTKITLEVFQMYYSNTFCNCKMAKALLLA